MGALSTRQQELLDKYDPATREVGFTGLLNEVLDRGVKNYGTGQHNILDLPAVLADEETVTIGGEVYEVALLTTDSGVDTASDELNNTTEGVTVTITAHGLIAGDLVLVESEVMRVAGVVSVDKVALNRGRCGTTAAAHADGNDYLTVATPGAGKINVGVADTAAASFSAALVGTIAEHSVRFAASDQTDHVVVWTKDEDDDAAVALAETLGGAGNAWLLESGTAMVGGNKPRIMHQADHGRQPTAAEVTKGAMYFSFPELDGAGAVVIDQVRVMPLATLGDKATWKAHDGATAVAAGGLIKVTNDGAVDFAATDLVVVTALAVTL